VPCISADVTTDVITTWRVVVGAVHHCAVDALTCARCTVSTGPRWTGYTPEPVRSSQSRLSPIERRPVKEAHSQPEKKLSADCGGAMDAGGRSTAADARMAFSAISKKKENTYEMLVTSRTRWRDSWANLRTETSRSAAAPWPRSV
jgi:hypothetical protein